MRIDIAYGKKGLSLNIPAKRVRATLAPKPCTSLPHLDKSIRLALRRPYQSPPLAQLLTGKKSALIITVDNTRPSPRPLLQPMIDACNDAGVRASIIIATGRHRQMTPKELKTHLGPAIMRHTRVLQHDPFDTRNMRKLGTTKLGTPIRVNSEIFRHDLILGCGIIEPSYLAGWSGGRKLIMPGLAHHQSVDNNHYYLTHPDTRIGKLHGNPLSDDALEFARKLPFDFILYTVNGPNDEVVKVVAGHPYKAHEHACKLCANIYRTKRITADIVISSAGGYPYDCDLVQGKKAIIPAIESVNRNGVIILCAACSGGLGAEDTFINWLTTKTPGEVVHDVMDKKLFSLGAHGANILARPIVNKNATVILVTSPTIAKQLSGSYITALTSIEQAWSLANMLTTKQSDVLLIEKARRLIVT